MKRMTRDRRLTPEEAAKYKAIREQVAEELPDLIARHHERMEVLGQLQELLQQLKAAREAKGLSLADLAGQLRTQPAHTSGNRNRIASEIKKSTTSAPTAARGISSRGT